MFLFDTSSCFRHWIDHYIDRCSSSTITSPVQAQLSDIIHRVDCTIKEAFEVEAASIDSWISTLTNSLQGTLPHINDKGFH